MFIVVPAALLSCMAPKAPIAVVPPASTANGMTVSRTRALSSTFSGVPASLSKP